MAEDAKKAAYLKVTYINEGEDDTSTAQASSTGLQFVWANGEVQRFMFDEFSEEVRKQAMAHGFNQKIRDSAAMKKGTPVTDRISEVQATVETLQEGDWNKVRKGVSSGTPKTDLFAALVTVNEEEKGRELSEEERKALADKFSTLDADTRKAYAAHPRIAAVLKKMRAERAAKAAKDAAKDAKGSGIEDLLIA